MSISEVKYGEDEDEDYAWKHWTKRTSGTLRQD
jgi:hypothetical protein